MSRLRRYSIEILLTVFIVSVLLSEADNASRSDIIILSIVLITALIATRFLRKTLGTVATL